MENERPRIVDAVILVIAKRDNVYSINKTKSVGLNEKRKSISQFIFYSVDMDTITEEV
jgi:hypothetical protein